MYSIDKIIATFFITVFFVFVMFISGGFLNVLIYCLCLYGIWED